MSRSVWQTTDFEFSDFTLFVSKIPMNDIPNAQTLCDAFNKFCSSVGCIKILTPDTSPPGLPKNGAFVTLKSSEEFAKLLSRGEVVLFQKSCNVSRATKQQRTTLEKSTAWLENSTCRTLTSPGVPSVSPLSEGGSGMQTNVLPKAKTGKDDTTLSGPPVLFQPSKMPPPQIQSHIFYSTMERCTKENRLEAHHRPCSWKDDLENPLIRRTTVPLRRGSHDFTVATWNVLYPGFTDGHEVYCPPEYLLWLPHRMSRVLDCIQQLNADIIALQEVGEEDTDDFRPFYSALRRMGYTVYVVAKIVQGTNRDACCLAYRMGKFQLVENTISRQLLRGNAQVGICMHLLHVALGQHLVVSTCHLRAAKLDEQVRVQQFQALVEDAVKLAGGTASVILLGDFNTEPKWELVKGIRSGDLTETLGPMGEAYSDHPEVAFEDKQYTVMMPHTQDQLDYIFHSQKVQPTAILAVPGDRAVVWVSQRDLRGHLLSKSPHMEHLPTPSFPSDHIPLWSAFRFKT